MENNQGTPKSSLVNIANSSKAEVKKVLSEMGLPSLTYRKSEIGRNDPCPCGSGKKYKKCCLGREVENS